MSAPTAKKTTPETRVPRHGHGKLLTGGKIGGSGGRPRDEFYGWLGSVIYSTEARDRFERIVKKGKNDLVFLKAFRWGDERLHGKPPQTVSITELPAEERVTRILSLVDAARRRSA